MSELRADSAATIVPADAAGVERAAGLLRAESICAFPTETVYGLGASASSARALSEVYRLKNRPRWNPTIVHVAHPDQARALARGWPDVADELAAAFWPGPLSLVVRRNARLPDLIGAATDTIAIRIPAHPVALALLTAFGSAVAAPSANRSETVSPTTARHVVQSLPEVPLVLDGGPCRLGIESTVLDLTESPPRLLRPGALPLHALREAIGFVDLPVTPSADGTVRSPGSGRRHYAPQARVVASGVQDFGSEDLRRPVGVLTYSGKEGGPGDLTETLPGDPAGYAVDFYAALHRLDDAGMSSIVIVMPPETEDWLAIRDRIRRAAALD